VQFCTCRQSAVQPVERRPWRYADAQTKVGRSAGIGRASGTIGLRRDHPLVGSRFPLTV
jgi:hypothetical protein